MKPNNSCFHKASNQSPLFSVTAAVCVRNGATTIERCIQSLLRLNYPSDLLRIIVIDNGSVDGTTDIIKHFPVELIHEPRIGRAMARNRAIAECRSDLLAFTDSDCEVTPDWLISLVHVFSDPNIAAAGGPIHTPGPEPLARYYQLRHIVSNEEFIRDYPFSKPFLATANAVFRMDTLKQCQGFREDYSAAEDADLCWRLQQAGYRIVYMPKGVVYHHHRTTLMGLFRQSIEYGFHGVAVYLNHRAWFPPKRWLWFGLYIRLLLNLIRLPFAIFRKDPFLRRLPWMDVLHETGLILGRLKAAIRFRTFLL